MEPERFTRTKRVRGGHGGRVAAALVAVLSGVAAASYFVDDALAASGPAAPSITSEPSNPSTSTSAAFTFTDTSSGVTFKCSRDSAAFATCASGVSYSGLAQGSHTFKVEAVSGTSTSSATSYSWAIVPPTPTITSEPSNPTTATSASFKYSDTLSGVSFLCSLNGASFSSCASSGVTETVTNAGSNTFSVEAQVGSNTPSAAASDTWTVTTPTPTISSEPANPTNSTSATFKYSDSQTGDTFKCSLDGASYTTCASGGVTYSGLSNATHTFGVEAALGSGPASSAATYSWLVHTMAPTITLTFPASGSYYNAASWAAGCSTVGVCGTAADPVGVTSVGVAVLQQSSGKYWNGASFSSSSQVFNTATGTTSWYYPLARPADGAYTLYVRATDTLGNTTSSSGLTTASFTIDTVAPAAPVISVEESTSTDTEFEFTDTGWPNVTFSCDLDSGTVMNCTGDTDHDGDSNTEGEWDFTNLAPGPHCFYVWATDKAGNVSPTSSYCWTVVGPPASVTEVSGSPQSATVHTAFGSPLVVKVTDSHGDPVPGASVTFSAPTSGASGTFSNGSTTITATTGSNGEVSETFTANTTAGGPYTVTAKVSGVSSPADFSLTNTLAAASKLVFITQPSSGQNVTAGSTTAFKVAVEDAYGNIETSDTTTTVSLSFSANPGSSTLTCTNSGGSGPLTVSGGVASFTCSLNKTGSGYKLSATSVPARTAATSNSFNVVAATASQLVFTTEPPASTVASSTFSTSVTIEDLYGNKVTSDSSTVKIALYTNPCGGTVSGTTSKAASGGVASFSGLQITMACSGYQLSGADVSDGPMLTTSSPFAITAAGASRLVFTTEPPASTPSTSTFAVTLTIEDTYGNTVTSDTHTVALSLSPNPCSGTLSGTKSKAASSGVASFSGLQITKVCTGYKLSATDTSDSLTATSTAFAISTASANAISVVSGNNQSATQGASFTAPLVVEVTNGGNPVSGASVTLSGPALTTASGTFSNSSNTITATTGTNGKLSESFTANLLGGAYTVGATTPGATSPADFSLLNGMTFSINGKTSSPFYPGTTESVDLSITNPNPTSDELTVNSASLSLVVTPDASHASCQASWFTLNPGSWSVGVQGGTTEALSDLGVATGNLPTVTMTDVNSPQNACEGATLSLRWSANGNGAP